MKSFFITLDRTLMRKNIFEFINSSKLSDCSKFPAVDGQKLNRSDLVNDNSIAIDLEYNPAALGCAVSHIALWRYCAASNEPITIFEDDAICHKEFELKQNELITRLGTDWDYIVWGWNFDCLMQFDMVPGISYAQCNFIEKNIAEKWDEYAAAPIDPRLYRLNFSFGTPAYSLSPSGAKKLLDALPIRNFLLRVNELETKNKGIDIFLIKASQSLRSFVSVPPLVLTPNIKANSTIYYEATPNATSA